MFTLRCTKNLLRRLRAAPAPSAEAVAAAPTTRLGDWHANLLYRPGGQLILLVNDRSLLPVLVPASPKDLIVSRFIESLGSELRLLGAPREVVSAELAEMGEVELGPTQSRQLLGTMNDFDTMLDDEQSQGRTLEDAALRLAEAPCGPLAMRSPNDVAVELLVAGE